MIILISGKAGSGKDVLSDYLVKHHYFTKIAFADPIKRILKDVFDLSDDELWGSSELRSIPITRYPKLDGGHYSVRDLAQSLGTGWGREICDNVWVDYLIRAIKNLTKQSFYKYSPQRGVYVDSLGMSMLGQNENVIITDGRFLNEINALKDFGAKIVRIKRNGAGLSGETGSHISETEQDAVSDDVFDFIVDNNGSLEDLYQQIEKIYSTISYNS